MQQFFAIIKTDAGRDYAVATITRESILELVEQEFDVAARVKAENDPHGVKLTAWNYLSGKYQLIELYDYDLSGAMRFMAAAHGIGAVYELEAIKHVQVLRDGFTSAIERATENVRDAFIARMEQFKWANPEEKATEIARVKKMDAQTLGFLANLGKIL